MKNEEFEASISCGAIYSHFEEIKNLINCNKLILNETNKDFRWSEKGMVHKGLPT